MTNSYCGKNCTFCISKKEGKCIGCKPEVHVPLHSSIYIAGVNNSAPGGLLADKARHQDSENDNRKLSNNISGEVLEAVSETGGIDNWENSSDYLNNDTDLVPFRTDTEIVREEKAVKQGQDGETDNNDEKSGVRFSEFCQIAICCRKGNMDGCNECQKTFVCEKYSKKGIMNVIIDSKMEAWGMVDHGLKNAVPFLYVLLGCFLVESFFTVFSWAPIVSNVFFIFSAAVAGVRAYAFYKLRSFNTDFLTVAVLTIVYIFSLLFNMLLTIIDYGVIGMLLSLAGATVQLVSSVLCYKITFDAYAELVSPVDVVLEKRWLKIWKLTIILYIIAIIVSLLTMDKTGVSGFVLYFSAASLVLNIITFILMVTTIRVCKND